MNFTNIESVGTCIEADHLVLNKKAQIYHYNLGYLVIFKILHAGLKQLYVKWHNIDCKNRIINGIFRNTIYTKWGRLIQNMKNSKCQNIK